MDFKVRLELAVNEAFDLEPLADSDGIPSYNDSEGYAQIALQYGFDVTDFEQHLVYLSSEGLVGSKLKERQ